MAKAPCPVDPFGSGVHSEDRVTVHMGRTEPVVVCGYHYTYWPELCAQDATEGVVR